MRKPLPALEMLKPTNRSIAAAAVESNPVPTVGAVAGAEKIPPVLAASVCRVALPIVCEFPIVCRHRQLGRGRRRPQDHLQLLTGCKVHAVTLVK